MPPAISLVVPLAMLFISLLIGALFRNLQIEVKGRKLPIPLIVFAVLAGVGVFLFALYFPVALGSVSLFEYFAAAFKGTGISIIEYNTQFVAAMISILLLEVGLGSGFGLAQTISIYREKRKAQKTLDETEPKKVENDKPNPSAGVTVPPLGFSSMKKTEPRYIAEEQELRRDEQSVIELFLYGKVTQITPVVNMEKPEGYYYEGIPQLDWDTKRSRQVFDALVRKGYLTGELVDKLVVCLACGSANVRVRKNCPECNSLRLSKEALLEHFACGAVERKATFETQGGDLVCPKCKGRLKLIGSDYRILPPAYLCLECNTLNSQPALTIKCSDCSSTAQIDEEPELLLYKYSPNPQYPLQELQQIKPLDICTQFFKALGYSIVAPAFVTGRSGTQHLFDILVMGRVNWVETDKPTANTKPPHKDNGKTAVEVLISSKPVALEEITRIYGKISDIDCDFLLFAIPELTANARTYAKAFGIKFSEGKNIEEALANSKIMPSADKA